MMRDRTDAMASIGILSICLGLTGLLLGSWSLLSGLETTAAEAITIGMMVACVGLGITGAAVLTMQTWGRPASILAGLLVAVLAGVSMFVSFDVLSVLFVVYGVVSASMFFRPSWKEAFTDRTQILYPHHDVDDSDERFRPAA